MRRTTLILIVTLVFLIFSPQVFGATALVINSATVEGATFELSGANFQAFGALDVWIGDICLTCPTVSLCPTIGPGTIECSFSGTPAESGGTWTVRISAGNAPHKNEEIDVFIPTGLTVGCNPGDYVECYTGDPATNGVGECQSGIRTCAGGSWSDCVGQVLPLPEEICGDSLDNDCDGVVNNDCPLCTEQELIALDECMNTCNGSVMNCALSCMPDSESCSSGLTALFTCAQGYCDLGGNDYFDVKYCAYLNCPDQYIPIFGTEAPTECTSGETRSCGTDVGNCQPGVEHCVNGIWSDVCEGAIEPTDEICNEVDDDCDGVIDNVGCDVGNTYYQDIDSDTWGTTEEVICACSSPGEGYATRAGDCDDYDESINPDAEELCDGVDNNCNEETDEDPVGVGDSCCFNPPDCTGTAVFECVNHNLVCVPQ